MLFGSIGLMQYWGVGKKQRVPVKLCRQSGESGPKKAAQPRNKPVMTAQMIARIVSTNHIRKIHRMAVEITILIAA
jgi:hypothetical protein